MREQFELYIVSLYQDIPQEVYEGLLSIFCIGVILLVVWKGIKTAPRYSAALLLIEYTFLLFCSTAMFRTTGEARRYNFHPFWSYNDSSLFVENVMNAVVFVPIGLLLGIAINYIRWWQVLLISSGISVSVETLQFVFMKGFSELDDVMHNTLGGLLGFLIYSAGLKVIRYAKNEIN